MRKVENARKLITKLQKFCYLEEKHGEKPNEDRITYSGLSKVKDVEGDRNTVRHLLEELKDDLETYKAKCEDKGLKKNARDVIFEVACGIKYFSKLEFSREKQKRLSTLQYPVIIFSCYGVFLIEE